MLKVNLCPQENRIKEQNRESRSILINVWKHNKTETVEQRKDGLFSKQSRNNLYRKKQKCFPKLTLLKKSIPYGLTI